MKKWKLDEAGVHEMGGGGYSKSHGHAAKTKHSVEVTLIHAPTGVSISKSTFLESISQPAEAKMRENIRNELMPKLKELAAKYWRIPGH